MECCVQASRPAYGGATTCTVNNEESARTQLLLFLGFAVEIQDEKSKKQMERSIEAGLSATTSRSDQVVASKFVASCNDRNP